MLTTISEKEKASIIAAFLNKHGSDRTRLTISDYEFKVSAFYEISINSINQLPDEAIQFQGNSKISRTDRISGVSQSDVNVAFHGVAFTSTDKDGDEILYKVQIEQLKDTAI